MLSSYIKREFHMDNAVHEYVHGYSRREIKRLVDQSKTLAELLHSDTKYSAGTSVLEVGCGVGAQTVTLVKNSPGTHFTCVDISNEYLQIAKSRVEATGYHNATFQKADIFNLPFPDSHFDGIFVCFVLEHLKNPVETLSYLKSKIKPGGSITVIEGDHGSTYFHPDSKEAWQTIQCLIDLQSQMGGNSLIGRQLFPLLTQAAFKAPSISPRMVYVDSSRPEYVEGFTKNTFISMVEGVRNQAINSGIIDELTWEKGIKDLYRTTEMDGTFCYTFFKGVAYK
jgi:ubiquinone/menaquinone biosynthesis C-methylase UbiE